MKAKAQSPVVQAILDLDRAQTTLQVAAEANRTLDQEQLRTLANTIFRAKEVLRRTIGHATDTLVNGPPGK